MADLTVYPLGTSPDIVVPANGTLAVWSQGAYQVQTVTAGVNQPAVVTILSDRPAGSQQFQSGVLSTTVSTTLRVFAYGQLPVYYALNSASATANASQVANVRTGRGVSGAQGTPATLNASGTLAGGMILNGLITSTSAAIVTATLDTGAVMDTISNWAIDDFVEFTVINTGPSAFNVTASAGHTLSSGLGSATILVATTTQARFQTRKTAAATFVTTRIA